MKSLFVLPFLFLALQVQAASTTVTLPPRQTNPGSGGDLPAMIDLTAEMKKLNIQPESRLLQLDLVAQAGPTGAIFALMISGIAVDSYTVIDDKEVKFSLVPDSSTTPAPWILGVRGDVKLKEIRIVMTNDKKAETVPKKKETPPETKKPKEITPAPKEPRETPKVEPRDERRDEPRNQPRRSEEGSSADDLVGREVIVVSRTSGRIDYVTVRRRHPDGTYSVMFQGLEYDGFTRDQIALLDGCEDGLCVGHEYRERLGGRVLILGRLPGGRWVVNDDEFNRYVLFSEDLLPREAHKTNPPQPTPQKRADSGDFKVGDAVLYIHSDDSVTRAQLLDMGSRGYFLKIRGTGQEVWVSQSKNLARTKGCLSNFCVGDQVTAYDQQNVPYRARIIGLQGTSYAVVKIENGDWEIGNWPLRALRP